MQPTVLKTENRSGRKKTSQLENGRGKAAAAAAVAAPSVYVPRLMDRVIPFFPFSLPLDVWRPLDSQVKISLFLFFLVISSSSFFLFLDVIKPFVNAITCVYRETS
jgi:hypothetical protein